MYRSGDLSRYLNRYHHSKSMSHLSLISENDSSDPVVSKDLFTFMSLESLVKGRRKRISTVFDVLDCIEVQNFDNSVHTWHSKTRHGQFKSIYRFHEELYMVLTCTQQKIHLRKADAAFNLALHSDKPHPYYSDEELKSIFFERKGEKLVEVWDNVAEEKERKKVIAVTGSVTCKCKTAKCTRCSCAKYCISCSKSCNCKTECKNSHNGGHACDRMEENDNGEKIWGCQNHRFFGEIVPEDALKRSKKRKVILKD